MKKTLFLLALFISAQAFAIQTVNAVIGDKGWESIAGTQPGEKEKIQAHLLYVETFLRSESTNGLNAEQRSGRMKLLDALCDYRCAGNFPVNEDFPGERMPHFIDSRGNICAVGYLVEVSAGRAEAERINALYSYNYISEMHDARLNAWMQENGLTALECAMIQPAYHIPIQDRVVGPVAPVDSFASFVTRRIEYKGAPDSCVVTFYAHRLGPATMGIVESGNRLLGDAALNAIRSIGNVNYWAYPRTGNADTSPVFVRMKIMYGLQPPAVGQNPGILYSDIALKRDVRPRDEHTVRFIGHVADAQSKAPVGGTIAAAYDAQGYVLASALTDYNGNYELNVPAEKAAGCHLVFTTEGYEPLTVTNMPGHSGEADVKISRPPAKPAEKCTVLSCLGTVYIAVPAK